MSGIDHVAGQTWHGRRGPVAHGFRYSVDYLLIEDMEAQPAGPRLFSWNRFNLAGLREADHGGAPRAGRGAAWVREVLAAEGIVLPGLRIDLLTQPRILGHVFNPVSFWLLRDAAGLLRVVIAEVSNTFGDRHSYLVAHPDLAPIGPGDRLAARKVFHVSPFQEIAGAYAFRFDIDARRVGVWIDYTTPGGAGIFATLTGHRRKLTNAGIISACIRRPLGSRRVLALIHWQALKLWWKGARYRRRPEPPAKEVTR